MKRIETGFEWEDQPWFPSFLRQYMMDFLRFVLNTGNLYQPITPLLLEGLEATNKNQIIDLCSGGGGAVKSIQNNVQKLAGKTVPIVLTDLYPNIETYQILQSESNGVISFYEHPVNATNVPTSLQGFRTIFSGFHHFDPATAKQVLQNAAQANEGIAIFDGGNRGLAFILLILVFHPLAFLFFTPFIKPFSIRRLFFTYLIPIIPFCTIWDGIVSVLRLYTPDELKILSQEVNASGAYVWKSGTVTNFIGIRIAYLLGYPAPKIN